MNRRVSGLAFAIAASSLAAAVFLLRNWAIPADGPIVIVKAPPPTSIAPRRRLPKALSLDPGRLPVPGDPELRRRPRPGYDAATVETVRGRVAMSRPLDNRLRQGAPPQRLI